MITAKGKSSAANLAARWPTPVLVALAVLIPGLPSLLLRGFSQAFGRMVSLWFCVGAAYVLCGPIWGGLLFAHSPHWVQQLGLAPFIAACLAVVASSVRSALDDRGIG